MPKTPKTMTKTVCQVLKIKKRKEIILFHSLLLRLDEKEVAAGTDAEKKKRKKKKKKNKKKDDSATATTGAGSTGKWPGLNQTSPPTIPVANLPQFKSGEFPVGEIQEHAGSFNTYRTTSEEKRVLDKVSEGVYNELREAAEVHRQTRRYINDFIKPGMTMTEIAK